MTAKSIKFGSDARARIALGVDILSLAVAKTLGPRGRNVIIEQSYGAPLITKDGVTVAKSIELADRFKNMGAQMVKQVASNTNDQTGDGTTTATVLAHSIFKEGLKAIEAGMNPMDIKRGIDHAVSLAVEALAKISTSCDDNKAIEYVATISANGDKFIGKLLAQAMDKAGKDGAITVEEGTSLENELTLVEGMQFERGYLSPYFINNVEKMLVELEDPYILLHDKKISRAIDLIPVLEAIAKSGRPLLIIAEDIEGEALSTLVINQLHGKIKVVAIKTPEFGLQRQQTMADIAVLTSGDVISEENELLLKEVDINQLGRASKITVSKNTTTIINGAGEKKRIQQRIYQLTQQMDNDITSKYDKDKLRSRIAKLAGGVAVLKIGAASEIEMKEKKDRVDDALHAVRAAIEEGAVPGGGVALLQVMRVLKEQKILGKNADQQAGIHIVLKALRAPIHQIATNAGKDGNVIINRILDGKGSFGYNAQTDDYGDLLEMGILDPTKVVRTALQNAASIAGLLITIAATVTDMPKIKARKAKKMNYRR
jgi:chaperonin GroEL